MLIYGLVMSMNYSQDGVSNIGTVCLLAVIARTIWEGGKETKFDEARRHISTLYPLLVERQFAHLAGGKPISQALCSDEA